MSWNPQQYLKFGGERLRPAHDLLARVALDAPGDIVDLGCGAGNVTALLRARWPAARIAGVDSSNDMLKRARATLPDVDWRIADIAQWSPAQPVDLIYSNAALQWLGGHASLFPRLLDCIKPGGVFAVQMPAQHDAPSHQIGYRIAESERWRAKLQPLVRRKPILEPSEYYDIVRQHVSTLDMWFTEYVQALSGDNPVVEFTKGSFVGAWLAALDDQEKVAFENEYRAAIVAAYPPRANGITLFPFRRFFLVAQR